MLMNIAMVLFGYDGRVCGHEIQAVEFHLGTISADNLGACMWNLSSAMELVVKASKFARSQLEIPCKVLCDLVPAPGKSYAVELATQTDKSWILTPMRENGACHAVLARESKAMFDAWKVGQLSTTEYSDRLSVLQKLRSKLGRHCEEQLRDHSKLSHWREIPILHWKDRARQQVQAMESQGGGSS